MSLQNLYLDKGWRYQYNIQHYWPLLNGSSLTFQLMENSACPMYMCNLENMRGACMHVQMLPKASVRWRLGSENGLAYKFVYIWRKRARVTWRNVICTGTLKPNWYTQTHGYIMKYVHQWFFFLKNTWAHSSPQLEMGLALCNYNCGERGRRSRREKIAKQVPIGQPKIRKRFKKWYRPL